MTKDAPSTLIGFDFGMKRIGLAVGQTVTKSARPLKMIKANQGIPDWQALDKIIKIWMPDAFIVGVPLNMDGTEQSLTAHVYEFMNQLSVRYTIPVYGMDERLSTVEARDRLFQTGGFKALQNGQVDSVAAQLILQNWLNLKE